MPVRSTISSVQYLNEEKPAMKMILDFAWMIGSILSMVALLYGAYLSLMESESVRKLLGKKLHLTDLSTQISGTQSGPQAVDLSC